LQTEDKYLHGFTETERQRLIGQAEVLSSTVFKRVDFASCQTIYEPGSGVGAQTLQLLRRFPHLHITSIEKSPSQVEGARKVLAPALAEGRVTLRAGDALNSDLKAGSVDGAFICWLLEHLPDPAALLKEVHRVLKPGGIVYVTEVFNPSLFFSPNCPTISRYWEIFSDYQRSLSGDPCAGIHLGNLLTDSGFAQVKINPLTFMIDKRPENLARKELLLDYWWDLFMSAKPGLEEQGLVNSQMLATMALEYRAFRSNPDLVFYAAAIQAHARKTV
jgi:SAM-dependent methyltransferase